MSYTIMYGVPKKGQVFELSEFDNSWLGAMSIWNTFAIKFLGMEGMPMWGDSGKKVFNLVNSNKLCWQEKVVLASTFDKVMVKVEMFDKLIEAFEFYKSKYKDNWTSNLEGQVKLLNDIKDGKIEKDIYAICWCQTSVSDDIWYSSSVMDMEADEFEELEEYMWDISQDEGHWFLFEEDFMEQIDKV